MTTVLGETVTVDFTTHDPTTGAAMSAAILPTGVLVRNGVDSAEVVTVTNKAVGIYRASATIPAGWAVGDEAQIRINGTVNAIPGNACIWCDTLDDTRLGTIATAITNLGVTITASFVALTAIVNAGFLAVTNDIAALAVTLAGLPAAVWTYATRTLTSWPWLIAKIEEAIRLGGTPWVDWVWERYTTKVVTVQVLDAGGYPVNITGWSIRWVAGSYLDKSTTAATITITAPLSGVFTFTVTAAESLLMPYGDLAEATAMSCKGQEPGGGAVHLIFEGKLRYKGTLITTV